MRNRVLHIIDTTGPGGAETVFVELADGSRAHGFEPIALVKGEGWVLDSLRTRGVPTLVLKPRGRFRSLYLLALMRLIRAERVGLIQTHFFGASLYGGLAALPFRLPVVATFHGAVDFIADERFKKIKIALMNVGVSQYVAVSHSLKIELEERGIGPVDVIHNGIDQRKYCEPREQSLRSKLHLDDDAILVGSLGNVRPAKAYDNLLRAARIVINADPRVHFTIAGDDDNEEGSALKRLCVELGLQENVHFLGFQDDAPSYLAALDIFALSSTSEGFSIATIEAQAAGVPVVVTRSGGPEEIVEHNVNGLLVESDCPEELAKGIVLLVNDGSLRRRLAEAGRETAARRFSTERMIELYAKLYAGLCDRYQ